MNLIGCYIRVFCIANLNYLLYFALLSCIRCNYDKIICNNENGRKKPVLVVSVR